MPFVTDNTIATYLAAHLGTGDTLETRYTSVLIPAANIAAYNAIVGKLSGRGFTAAQIADWDRGEEFNKDLALCHLRPSVKGGDNGDEWKDRFCRLDELDDLDITIDGEVIEPDASETEIGYGDMTRSDDEFTRETVW